MVSLRALLEEMVEGQAHPTSTSRRGCRPSSGSTASWWRRRPSGVAHAGGHAAAGLQRAERRAEEALRERQGARLLVRRQGAGALPRQRASCSAASSTMVDPADPVRDHPVRGARAARRRCGRSPTCRAGLVLVTGPTGSGKSTTLAALIDRINSREAAAHHHDRGPDRVHAPAQAVHREPARGGRRHGVASTTR